MGGYSIFKKIQSNGKIKHSSVDYMVWFGYLIKLFCLSMIGNIMWAVRGISCDLEIITRYLTRPWGQVLGLVGT